MDKELWLNEAMLEFDKKFYKGVLNIVNAPAGCGKSTFVFNEFLNESYKYVVGLDKYYYKMNLNKILYICDTNMLKSSILQENQGITKILEKDDLKKAMKTKTLKDVIINNKTGYIKVITYSTLGWLLQQDGARYILKNYMNVFLMDEMQNLFKYANRFDNENNNKPYGTVINYLPTLVENSLVIALSATTGRISNGIRELSLKTNPIFTHDERKKIKQYKNKYESECKYMINEIKRVGICKKYFKKHNYKIFIYTNTIRQSEKYKTQLKKYGYKTEWLCSINNTVMNEDGEIIPKMNEYQLNLRENLIQTGILPDDLDVIIVNSGYETGWNLRDERVQFVLVDCTDEDTKIQARNRVRHDIEQLIHTAIIDSDGEIWEHGEFRQLERKGECIKESALKIELEDRYLGEKLTKEDKNYLVDRYAKIWFDKKEANWKTFKRDLVDNNYIVDNTNNGTYIYTKEEFENLKSKKDVKLNMDKNLINWIENEWDKKRITCQDIMDILDIGRKSFNNIIKNTEIVQYFKEHRYKVGTIKNSRTKYLMKY